MDPDRPAEGDNGKGDVGVLSGSVEKQKRGEIVTDGNTGVVVDEQEGAPNDGALATIQVGHTIQA